MSLWAEAGEAAMAMQQNAWQLTRAFAVGHAAAGVGVWPVLATALVWSQTPDGSGMAELWAAVAATGCVFTLTNSLGYWQGIRGLWREDLAWTRQARVASACAGAVSAVGLPLVGMLTEHLGRQLSRIPYGSILWVLCNIACAGVGAYLLGLLVTRRTLREASGFPVLAMPPADPVNGRPADP
jgi:hypothetical protein